MNESTEIEIKVVRLDHAADLPLPDYASPGAAGADLYCAEVYPIVLKPGERRAVPTGLVIGLPSGYEAQVRPRSGLAAADGVTVVNAPGTIDSDYRGEVKVLLVNLGNEAVTLRRGDRIAQIVVSPVYQATFVAVEELEPTTRGDGGFGSTGR
jgi:dUTP pyrophosphatase